MLIQPNCLNNDNIEVKDIMLAPYSSIHDLEMNYQLFNNKISRLKGFELGTITETDLMNSSCENLLSKYPNNIKYCNLCEFYSNNYLNRYNAEVKLLNHCYHKGVDPSINKSIFKYYLLNSYNEEVFITLDIFNLISENADNKDIIDAVLSKYYQDEEYIKKQVKALVNTITRDSLDIDIEYNIGILNTVHTKVTKANETVNVTDLISKTMLQTEEIQSISERSETKKKDNFSKGKTSNTIDNVIDSKSESRQLTIFNNLYEKPNRTNSTNKFNNDNNDEIKSNNVEVTKEKINGEAESAIDASKSEEHINNDTAIIEEKIETEKAITTQRIMINELNYSDYLGSAISNGKAYISTENEIIIYVEHTKIFLDPAIVPHSTHIGMKFLNLLFANRNIIKVVDDLSSLATLINLKKLYSVHEVKLLCELNKRKQKDFIRDYDEIIKFISLENLKIYKSKTEVELVKKLNISETSNVIYKVNTSEINFDEILAKAIKDRIFEKYDVYFHKSENKSLELHILGRFKETVIDEITNIIRSEHRSKGLKPTFERIRK